MKSSLSGETQRCVTSQHSLGSRKRPASGCSSSADQWSHWRLSHSRTALGARGPTRTAGDLETSGRHSPRMKYCTCHFHLRKRGQCLSTSSTPVPCPIGTELHLREQEPHRGRTAASGELVPSSNWILRKEVSPTRCKLVSVVSLPQSHRRGLSTRPRILRSSARSNG